MKNKVNNLIQLVNKSKSIAVIAHVNPDGDSIGAILGLGLALKKVNSNIDIMMSDDFPGKFMYLPGVHHIVVPKAEIKDYDLVFVLDCGDANRLGDNKPILKKSTIVNIDHHVSNDSFGDINIVDVKASSTCEIVYRVIKEGLSIEIDKDIATCLYTGIVSDTGSFKYDNTSPYTLRVSAELMELGIDTAGVSLQLYHSNSLNSVRFLAAVLKEMEIFLDGRVAFITMNLEDISAYNVQQEDMEGLINYCRDIEGVEVAVSLRELEGNSTKASFRGKTYFDVNQLASIFGGGGHKKASGATISLRPSVAKELILEEIQKMM